VEGRFVLSDPAVRARVAACLAAELPELAAERGAAGEADELVLGRTLGKDG
jgi:hypothetical protein